MKGMSLEQAMSELRESVGMEQDEFAEFLSQDEELMNEFANADIKDPFLNPNYTTVGEGLMINADGDVFNYDGETVGTMADLDVDGDGILNANDLEFVEATGEYKPVVDFGKAGDRYYIDSNGRLVNQSDVDLSYGDGGIYRDADGNEYTYAGKRTAAGEILDQENGILYGSDGQILAKYEEGLWVDPNGEYVGATKEEYLNAVMTGDTSGASESFLGDITKEEYDKLTGPQLVDDMFTQRGQDGQLSLTKDELSSLMNRFDSVEEFEQYMADQGFGVNVSSDNVVIVSGATTEDGIWNITDGSSVNDYIENAKETSETIFNDTEAEDVYDINDSPFQEQEKEPVVEIDDDDISESESNTTTVNTENTTVTGGSTTTTQPTLADLQTQYVEAIQLGDAVAAAALAEAITNAGGTVPATGGATDAVVETGAKETGITETGTPTLADLQTQYVEAVRRGDAAAADALAEAIVSAGGTVPAAGGAVVDDNNSTVVDDDATVVDDDATIVDDNNTVVDDDATIVDDNNTVVDDDATVVDDNNTVVDDNNSTVIQGPPGNNGVNGIDGVNGTNGINGTNGVDGINGTNGVDGINGTNGVDGINGTNGVDGINGTNGIDGEKGEDGKDGEKGEDGKDGEKGGDGEDGIDGKDGKDGGMLSGGGNFQPRWSELFAYSTLTPYQKKALAPYVDYIKQGRGMLS